MVPSSSAEELLTGWYGPFPQITKKSSATVTLTRLEWRILPVGLARLCQPVS
ncbi:MAG: hypothetical protein KDA66_16990 [Planctomycetaceae bacterium]|nr:hypothetical protein [Planctomycetaceae bacterium]